VLTGTGSIFSAGVDLFRVLEGGRAYLEQFPPARSTPRFKKLLGFEKPLVAAINGHAIAGGASSPCGADQRFLARGKATYGAPELKVGVPVPARRPRDPAPRFPAALTCATPRCAGRIFTSTNAASSASSTRSSSRRCSSSRASRPARSSPRFRRAPSP
jgi:hypothetical protein